MSKPNWKKEFDKEFGKTKGFPVKPVTREDLKSFISKQLQSRQAEFKKMIERKKWTFIEGIEMSEKAKKAIIMIHNTELSDILKEL